MSATVLCTCAACSVYVCMGGAFLLGLGESSYITQVRCSRQESIARALLLLTLEGLPHHTCYYPFSIEHVRYYEYQFYTCTSTMLVCTSPAYSECTGTRRVSLKNLTFCSIGTRTQSIASETLVCSCNLHYIKNTDSFKRKN